MRKKASKHLQGSKKHLKKIFKIKDAAKNLAVFFFVSLFLIYLITNYFIQYSQYYDFILMPAFLIAWLKEVYDMREMNSEQRKKYIPYASLDILFRCLGSLLAVGIFKLFWGV